MITEILNECSSMISLITDQMYKQIEQHAGFVRCGECEYFMKEYGCNWCRLASGLDGDLKDTDGCTKGKAKK